MGGSAYEPKRVLVTIRTYPTPSRNEVEVSCTGGITDDGQWIRLFPVPYRFLSSDKRFRKYQWVQLRARRCSDPRPESYQVDLDSITVLGGPLGTRKKWLERKRLILPLASPSLCDLQQQRAVAGQTLGLFKPGEIRRFVIKPDAPDWTPTERGKLLQHTFFQQSATFQPLEKIPYKFFYDFRCQDRSCGGHSLSCVDWELGQAYRKWRDRYGEQWEAALRNKFEREMVTRFDTHFFVGTVRAHPDSWIIVGLFYPPR